MAVVEVEVTGEKRTRGVHVFVVLDRSVWWMWSWLIDGRTEHRKWPDPSIPVVLGRLERHTN